MLRWDWTPMGKMTVHQHGKKFECGIYPANCVAAFIFEYKENGNDMYTIYSHFPSERDCKSFYKERGYLFGDKVTNIRLNLAFQQSRKLLTLLTQCGYQVKCFYKKPKTTKK